MISVIGSRDAVCTQATLRRGLNSSRRALVLAGLLALGGATSPATAQSTTGQSASPPIVTVPAAPPYPGPAAPRPRPDPSAITGIRIEKNGALITGPIGQRRVYIRLDKPVMPASFKTVWVEKPENCASALAAKKSATTAVPKGVLLVTPTQLIARETWSIQQIFVPLPSSFTLEMLNSGRQLVLPASKYRKATGILVIYSMPDGSRDYAEMTQIEQGAKLELRGQHGRETGLRCEG